MSQVITATFEDGWLKPDVPLDLPAQIRVRLTIEPLDETGQSAQEALKELDRLCEECPIDSDQPRLTRDQLHERR